MPSAVFVVDRDVRIVDFNTAASQMLVNDSESLDRPRVGDSLRCIHSTETKGGCGTSASCPDCLVRGSVTQSLEGEKIVRQKVQMTAVVGGKDTRMHFLVTTAPFSTDGKTLVLLVLEDITELEALRRIVPICSMCKKIRDDRDYWSEVESYMKEHLSIDFSHSLCPKCAREFYPEYFDD
jgi:hypothetical protein